MRTTLIINDELLAEAKKRAADRKSNVSAIVNEALRMALKTDSGTVSERAFRMPTYSPGRFEVKDTSPEELDELLVAEEAEAYRK
jgi:hypothetical protein